MDNTNIKRWEVSPYFMAAMTFGYKVLVISLVCSAETATLRGTHGTELERNQQYQAGFEPSLQFWRELKIPTEGKSTT